MRFKGYTLIELLIVMTISIIVFTVGFAGYRDFSRRQTLGGISKQIKADLRTAQQLATSGQKPKGVTCSRLVSYEFFRVNSYQYQLAANCDNNGTPARHSIKDVNLTNDISFTSTATGADISNPISFKVLGQGTNLISDVTLTINFNKTTNSETIVIGKGGNVK
jgi:prepilin-type N-terminal cleavage/methylation domain-containing protein